MLSELKFATLLVYNSKGLSENAQKSEIICGNFKNGNPDYSVRASEIILENEEMKKFFSNNSVLIPVPRSSPIKEDSLWPSKIIAEKFIENGIGSTLSTCLKRIKEVPKSSYQKKADDRTSVQKHLDSLKLIDPPLIAESSSIILIDDVLTLGRTAMASAITVNNMYSSIEIKFFGMMRTKSFKDQNILLNPQINTMKYSVRSGKVQMPD